MADPDDSPIDYIAERVRRGLGEPTALSPTLPIDRGNGGAHTASMSEERIARLEGAYDALKVVRPMTLAVISIFLAALIFVLGFLVTQQFELNRKVDAIPQRLSEEFRAMRTEMAAQTSAIANSITAARLMQTPPGPQTPSK